MPDVTMIKQGDGSYKLQVPEEQAANLEQRGMLEGLTGFQVMGINVGKPIAGLAIAGVSDILGGFLQGMVGGVGGRWAGAIPTVAGLWLLNTKTAKGWLGASAVEAGNIVLLADLVTDYIFNIRGTVAGLFKGVTQKQTTTLGQGGNGQKPTSIAEYNKIHGIV